MMYNVYLTQFESECKLYDICYVIQLASLIPPRQAWALPCQMPPVLEVNPLPDLFSLMLGMEFRFSLPGKSCCHSDFCVFLASFWYNFGFILAPFCHYCGSILVTVW